MPATLKQNCSYRILEKFRFAPKTEAAFWLKFLELSDEEKKELLDYYELDALLDLLLKTEKLPSKIEYSSDKINYH